MYKRIHRNSRIQRKEKDNKSNNTPRSEDSNRLTKNLREKMNSTTQIQKERSKEMKR